MQTRIETVDPQRMDETIMAEAGRLIAEGELVAFPTETVYGLGADALNVSYSGSTATLTLAAASTAGLKAGKSYTLVLNVTPENNAVNKQPTQVKLSVKVVK